MGGGCNLDPLNEWLSGLLGELETDIVLDNSLKRHVVIGMYIIGSGVSCIDVRSI